MPVLHSTRYIYTMNISLFEQFKEETSRSEKKNAEEQPDIAPMHTESDVSEVFTAESEISGRRFLYGVVLGKSTGMLDSFQHCTIVYPV